MARCDARRNTGRRYRIPAYAVASPFCVVTYGTPPHLDAYGTTRRRRDEHRGQSQVRGVLDMTYARSGETPPEAARDSEQWR